MTNRTYRLVVGSLLLIFLYLTLNTGIYLLILMMFLEGISGYLLPDVANRFWNRSSANDENLAPIQNKTRFSFVAERAWRLLVSLLLFFSFALFSQNLAILPQAMINNFSYINWFFPWFMGFAIFGAGISGICPVLISVKWAGFK